MSKNSNALINETSPYLQQHAHNPVNWYPWGEEALNKARAEDKPILVSIGYSACHWCHVMERESFENETTASLMNEHFINIKIDREERPDLDHIYMDAVQAIAGNGGWPLNVFLTPECKPFYGGTYFPPVKAFNRSSWTEVLQGVNNLFKEKRDEVEAQAEELTQHIGKSAEFGSLTTKGLLVPKEEIFHKNQLHEIAEQILKQSDKQWGGFGKAPKFPQTQVIEYLLLYHQISGNADALEQAKLSLDKMICGGIYDHIGGGFARYSTDEQWLAPHFEKMLYDNALLVAVLADAYRVTKKELYQQTIRETIAFLQREMLSDEGGFYAAIDADSEGEEGKFYVWKLDEIKEILGADASLFAEYFDISEKGNWEQKNIPRVKIELPEFAASENMDPAGLALLLEQNRKKLLAARNQRIRPQLDDKIIMGWNALMITALCKASGALSDDPMKEMAIKSFDFLTNNFKNKNSNGYYHTYKNGEAKFPAFLDDYAYFIQSCISLQEITSNTFYLDIAKEITEYVIDNFSDEGSAMFYYTHKDQRDIIVRKKEIYDGATPSGNAVMAANLQYLSIIYNHPVLVKAGEDLPGADPQSFSWQEMGVGMVESLLTAILKYPGSFAKWSQVLMNYIIGENEVAIIGPEYERKRDELLKSLFPSLILQSAVNQKDDFSLLAGKETNGETLIYICRNYSCQEPINDLLNCVNKLHRSSKIL